MPLILSPSPRESPPALERAAQLLTNNNKLTPAVLQRGSPNDAHEKDALPPTLKHLTAIDTEYTNPHAKTTDAVLNMKTASMC